MSVVRKAYAQKELTFLRPSARQRCPCSPGGAAKQQLHACSRFPVSCKHATISRWASRAGRHAGEALSLLHCMGQALIQFTGCLATLTPGMAGVELCLLCICGCVHAQGWGCYRQAVPQGIAARTLRCQAKPACSAASLAAQSRRSVLPQRRRRGHPSAGHRLPGGHLRSSSL